MSKRAADKEQWLPNNCDCGSKGGAYLKHYELMRCSCGRMHWALRPTAGGPLVLYPWPGLQAQPAFDR